MSASPRRKGGAEVAVEDLEDQRRRWLAPGRAALGVVGRSEYGPLRDALRSLGRRAGAVVALGIAGGLGTTSIIAWSVLADRISATLGLGGLFVLVIIEVVVAAFAALSVLRVDGSGRHRARTAAVGAALSAVGFAAGALAGGSDGIWGLVPSAVLGGLAVGVVATTHAPILWDTYRPEVRVRMFSAYVAVVLSSAAGAVMLAALSNGRSGPTWRTVLLAVAGGGVVTAAALARLPEPTPARWDRVRLDRMVASASERSQPAGPLEAQPDARQSSWERIRRVWVVPSARPLLLAAAASGLILTALPTYVNVLVRGRWDDSVGAWILGIAMLGNLAGLAWFGRRGEVGWRDDPPRLVLAATWIGLVAGVALAFAAVAPDLVASGLGLAVAFSGLAVLMAASPLLLLAVSEPECRSHAASMLGMATLSGAFVGQQILASVAARFGVQWALVVGGGLVVAVAARLARVTRTISTDVDDVVGDIVEAAELKVLIAAGRHLPLLRCHQIDFSYGQLQVLFGVDFTVDDGQMVALLGTNGAGKSTLLRAISGIGHVDRGTIHFSGRDITHVESDGRVRLGITQVAGGRAVFGALTVLDNLRVFGYTHGRATAALEAGIDQCFDAFPALATRKAQLASTLSGGEQQMLGVSKAFILRPKLLLIDELSLGLAPLVVADLLRMVRRINQSGTTVVLVEQSANVALSLVDHAYFMEKGEIRFDGPAQRLLSRPDLLRSVFLEGASRAVR